MKPVNRTKQKRRYLYAGIGIYLLILYFGLHLGAVKIETWVEVPKILEHMVRQPLEVFPINMPVLAKVAGLGLLAPMLLYSEYLRRRDLRPGVESGSAHWNEDLKAYNMKYVETRVMLPRLLQKLLKLFCAIPLLGRLLKPVEKKLVYKFTRPDTRGEGKTKNMIYSRDVYLSMDTRKTRLNNNVLVIGGSGTGKSRFVVKPNILQANCSYVITDPAGELLETMGSYLEEQGYDVRVFNLVQKDHSSCYNPFHYVREQADVLKMINALIKNTTPKGSSTSDPFWEKAETALLQALCFYLKSECNEEDQNFSSVMKLLRCVSAVEGQEDVDSTMDILMKDLAAKDPEHIAVQSYAVFKSAGGGKTAQSILISCQTRLQTFNLEVIRNLTNTDNIDLASIGDKKTALFCITPVEDTTFNYLVALLYTQLFESLYYHAGTECEGMRLPYHVRFLLDEFANIGTIPEFSQKLATMRKYEISCTIIIQALSQIKAMYKDDWEVLVGNCDSVLFLGGQDATTLEYISKKLGKETIRTINNSRSYGRSGGSSMSYNKAGRELMTPDEINVMDNNNCILFIRGLHPFFTVKYPLEKHPSYHLCGDADKSRQYDVRKVKTGQNIHENAEAKRMLRLMEEAQLADTRESEYEFRENARPVQTRSQRGVPLGEVKPGRTILPHSEVPPEALTPEQKAERLAAARDLRVVSTSHTSEKTREEGLHYMNLEQVDLMRQMMGLDDLPMEDEDASFGSAQGEERETAPQTGQGQ